MRLQILVEAVNPVVLVAPQGTQDPGLRADKVLEALACFVERPAKLRDWVSENKPKLSDEDFQTAKMSWYREDRGRETVREVVELLEAAGKGPTSCR